VAGVLPGEFVLAGLRNHPLQSGQWLGGLLLKPHTLVLFFPGLILARWRQVLAGFSLTALIVLADRSSWRDSQACEDRLVSCSVLLVRSSRLPQR